MTVEQSGTRYVTKVTRHGRMALTIGAVLPPGSKIASAKLNGHLVKPRLDRTSRGLEAVVKVKAGKGESFLKLQIG